MDLKAFFNRKIWQEDVSCEVQPFYFVNHLIGIVDGFGQVVKSFHHLCRFLEVELVVGEGKSFILHVHIVVSKIPQGRGRLFFTRVDAKQDVVCVKIILLYIV